MGKQDEHRDNWNKKKIEKRMIKAEEYKKKNLKYTRRS